MSEDVPNSDDAAIIARLDAELSKSEPSERRRIVEKFLMAVLGSIPWVGGFLSAAAEYRAEGEGIRQDSLQTKWLQEHQAKIKALQQLLGEIQTRFDSLGESIDSRIQSEEYLGLVRKAFRIWDVADTEEKRRYAGNLVVNATGTRVCSDDIVRLFLDWLATYHEAHFAVIREIFQNPGSTRFEIWTERWGELPREDSADADLFKLLIRDLSTGGVIRQERDVNSVGQFVRKTRPRTRKPSAPSTLESAFEDSKPYVLTDLGKQFVHYTMNEVIDRIGVEPKSSS